jgi:hypothetical protein
MAARTPTLYRFSAGDQTKLVARFTEIDGGDTWASGLGTSVTDWYFNRTDAPTSLTGATVTHSAGTFTFNLAAEQNQAGDLIVFGNF